MDLCQWKNLCVDRTNCPHADAVATGEGNDPFDASPCLDCATFWQEVHEIDRENGEGVAPRLAEALLQSQGRINRLSLQLRTKSREIDFLHDVGIFLQGSLGRDEVIAMALTAVTAGKGYGLNRAILLLVNEERNLLEGYLAVGPRRPEDAWRIWQEIAEHDYSLKEMAQHFLEEKMATERERFRDLLEVLTVPLDRTEHLFISVLNDGRSHHILDLSNNPGLDSSQAQLLGAHELVLVPLVSGAHRIGLLLADNLVSGEAIKEEDRHSLETFALPVSYAIERASLYERLRLELNRITEANQRLREQQELIVRMEKLALVGEMSADIAHHIRNPLAIIGGYARRLLKEISPDDEHREALVAILREAGQIGETVRHLLDYADARHPAVDEWDLGQAVTAVVEARSGELERLGIEWSCELPSGAITALFDLKKVDYSLRAVIGRAIESLAAGGRLSLAVERQDREWRVRVVASDTVMRPEEIEAVFAPLYSGQSEGVERPDIELALCARMLQQQGGHLEITSGPEDGTVYVIVLPVAKEQNHGETVGG